MTSQHLHIRPLNEMTFEFEYRPPISVTSASKTLNDVLIVIELYNNDEANITVQVSSPNYPDGGYPDLAHYAWLVRTNKADQQVNFQLEDLDIEKCCDLLAVFDGSDRTGRVLAVLSGANKTEQVFSSTQKALFIRFTSDCSVSGKGFSGRVQSAVAAPTARRLAVSGHSVADAAQKPGVNRERSQPAALVRASHTRERLIIGHGSSPLRVTFTADDPVDHVVSLRFNPVHMSRKSDRVLVLDGGGRVVAVFANCVFGYCDDKRVESSATMSVRLVSEEADSIRLHISYKQVVRPSSPVPLSCVARYYSDHLSIRQSCAATDGGGDDDRVDCFELATAPSGHEHSARVYTAGFHRGGSHRRRRDKTQPMVAAAACTWTVRATGHEGKRVGLVLYDARPLTTDGDHFHVRVYDGDAITSPLLHDYIGGVGARRWDRVDVATSSVMYITFQDDGGSGNFCFYLEVSTSG